MIFLIFPALALFIIFFAIPIGTLFTIAFNPSRLGVINIQPVFTLENFVEFFESRLYYKALINSVVLGATMIVLTLILGYPLAYLIAKTKNQSRQTLYLILILIPMQLDLIIRIYGLMTILGDNGLINKTLIDAGILSEPFPLMYNMFGTVIGLGQLSLPFMVLSLYGIIQNIDPSLEEAARGLGASRWQTFLKVTFPLSMPGILAGSLLVFAISISSYSVPVLMGGWRVVVMPIHIYQQISEMGYWQFGAAIAVILFVIALATVYLYHRYTQKYIGGLI
jgi:putative spermidine/putrescine transport system permease protein